jgi:glycosyltransferase involved in cell wall biosynthesis
MIKIKTKNNSKIKTISIISPCFNEEQNVENLYNIIFKIMNKQPYNYEHIFIDNSSTDSTVAKIKKLAKNDKNLKLIVNTRNFGTIRSPFYGITQSSGDACILIACDFQEPPELINEFIKRWENGFKVVLGKKETADGNSFIFFLRKKYYRFMDKISEVAILENCTGFGLFDKDLVSILRKIDDPYPYFRGLLMEIGFPVSLVSYNQPKRTHGKSSYSFYSLYDYFMLGVTQHSKLPLRIITMFGFLISIISLLVACYFLIAKVLFWDSFSVGLSPILIGIFFFGAIQSFFIGILGEYIGSISTKQRKLPLVIEKERINF